VIPFTSTIAHFSGWLMQLVDTQMQTQGKIIWDAKTGFGVIDFKKVKLCIVGIVILLFIQIFGVVTNILKEIAFFNAETKAQLNFYDWGYDLLVLAYQFGYLILPSIAPIVIWIGQFQHSLFSLVTILPNNVNNNSNHYS